MESQKFGQYLSKTGTFIQNNKKPLLWVGGSIIAVIVAIAVVKRLKGVISGQNVKGSDYKDLVVDKTKTTISPEVAHNYAEQLYDAFNYYWGTDLATIKSVFSKINSEDFKQIYNAFGQRTYSTINGGKPSGSIIGLDNPTIFGSNPDLDLIGWFNKELGILDFVTKNQIRPIIEGAGFTLA